MTRACEYCHRIFSRDPRVGRKQWAKQRFCSDSCSRKGRALVACEKRGFGPETTYYQAVMQYGSICAAARAAGVHARTLERRLWIEGGFCGSCGLRPIAREISGDKCLECRESWYKMNVEWRASEEGQQYAHAYVRTEEYKTQHEVVSDRYLNSEKGQAWYQDYMTGSKSESRRKKHRDVNKKYNRTDKGQKTMSMAYLRRRELEYRFDVEFTWEDLRLIRDTFGHKCFICGMTQEQHQTQYGRSLHVDHFKPLSKGYGLSLDNSVLLCQFHNNSKSAKNPEDFFTQDQIKQIEIIWKDMICQKARKA